MSPCHEIFYEELEGFADFHEFPHAKWYAPLPTSWFVVITDVQGSTNAIQAGRYKDVNALGVASIVAVLNAVKPLQIPYVFGGDGATFCIPPSSKQTVESALIATKQMAERSFGLHLRVGMVSMQEIQRNGHQVRIGKYQPSEHYQQAMFLGDGLGYAESLVKDPRPENPFLLPEADIAPNGNFEGFECRWNEIPSPHDETITLLVQAFSKDDAAKEAIYEDISKTIVEIYGQDEQCHPMRHDQLSLTWSIKKLSAEIRIRTLSLSLWERWRYITRVIALVFAGKWLMSRKVKTEQVDWGRYKQIMIANTDYRKFDELLRMVISGTMTQRKQLRDVLDRYRDEGKIVFGIHAAPTALMTCVISDYNTRHVHFLDGSNGGYALAAKEMKQQLKARQTNAT